MKLLGKLNASSLQTGDLIRIAGYVTKIVTITVSGWKVNVETEMFHAVEFHRSDKVSLFSKFD